MIRIRASSSPRDKTASQQIDEMIKRSDDWRGEKLSSLRMIIRKTDNRIIEEVKWKKPSKPEGVPVWSCNGMICVADTLKNAVRLTFLKGARIRDTKKLFNARLESNSVRAIDFHEGDKINETAMKEIVRVALALNADCDVKR